MRDDLLSSRYQVSADDPPGIKRQVNQALSAILSGSATIGGLRFDARTIVPTAAPESANSPNLVMVLVGTTYTLYWWNGAAWAAIGGGGGGGEANTGSNVNTGGGVGVFKQKTAVNLEFRGIKSTSGLLAVALNASTNEIELTAAAQNGLTFGTTTVDFGSTPVDEAVFTVANAAVFAGSNISAWFMEESTADNSTDEHIGAQTYCRLTCGQITGGVNFKITAQWLAGFATGTFKIRYCF